MGSRLGLVTTHDARDLDIPRRPLHIHDIISNETLPLVKPHPNLRTFDDFTQVNSDRNHVIVKFRS